MEDYKFETIKAFDKYSEIFDKKFNIYLKKFIGKEINLFLKKLKGKKILDLGCGGGIHSLFFREKGFDPLCIDLSTKMVGLCRKKGLNAIKMDIEDIKLDSKFDGILAYTSLIHFPKNKFDALLDSLFLLLKKDGLLFLGMKEGTGEGFIETENYPGVKRWFSLYTDRELINKLNKKFNIIYKSKTLVKEKKGDEYFLNYLCKLK